MAALPLRSRWALGLSLFAVAWGLALIPALLLVVAARLTPAPAT